MFKRLGLMMTVCSVAACTATNEGAVSIDTGPAASEVVGLSEENTALRTAFYDDSRIIDVYVSFTPDQWAQFVAYREAQVKEYVHCSVTHNGETFADAACRGKGDETVWPDEPKPGMIIKFNKWTKGLRFQGVKEFNLEANPYHSAPVRDRLGMWLMRQAGIDAPRVNHARVFLEGEYLGLYQNIEPIDEDFLKLHFAAATGNLYEQGYELKTNEDINDQTDLWALENLIARERLSANHTTFYAKLVTMMDVHEVLREMAAEVVLPTADNFSNGSDNFYYYHDPGRGFVVLPWDLDTIMDEYAPPRAAPFNYWGGAINNDPNKLRQLMNQNVAWKAEYINDLIAIRDGPYTQLRAEIGRICTQIRAAVAADPNKPDGMEDFDNDCASLQQRVTKRIAYLKTALGR